MITGLDYQHAIWAQDASNISGVGQTFARVLLKLMDEMRSLPAEQKTMDFVQDHPLVTLYLDKLVSLAHGYVQWGNPEKYGEALRIAREKVHGDTTTAGSSSS